MSSSPANISGGSTPNSNGSNQIQRGVATSNSRNTTTTTATSDNGSTVGRSNDTSSAESHDHSVALYHPYKATEERSEFACSLCRFHHKRCDKLLPSCSSCLKSGKTCEYSTVRKPEKKAKKNTVPYEQCWLINPSVNSTKKGVSLNMTNTLKYYKSSIFESVPKKDFDNLIESWDELDDSVSSFLFSTVAWAEQRIGSKEYGDICFQHARLLVASHFDNHTNIYAGMTLLNFVSHNLARKRYKEASMYLDLTKYFVSDLSENSCIAVKNTHKWLGLLRLGMHFTLTYEKSGAKGILDFFPIMSNQFLDVKSNFQLPTEREKLPQSFKVIELCSSYIDSIIQKNFDFSTSESHRTVAFLIHLFVEKGYKLALCLVADPENVTEAWNLSLEIATHAATNPYFFNVPLLTLPFVDLALSTYSRLVRDMVSFQTQDISHTILSFTQSLNFKFERKDMMYSNVEEMLRQYWSNSITSNF